MCLFLDIKQNFNWQRLFLPSKREILLSSRHCFIYLRCTQSSSQVHQSPLILLGDTVDAVKRDHKRKSLIKRFGCP